MDRIIEDFARDDVKALQAAQDAENAQALAMARLFIERGHRPDAKYVCDEDCVLLRAWTTPDGVIVAHPSARLPGARPGSTTDPAPYGVTGAVDFTGPVVMLRRRAYLLPRAVIFICCQHVWANIDGERVRADAARGKPVERVIPVDTGLSPELAPKSVRRVIPDTSG